MYEGYAETYYIQAIFLMQLRLSEKKSFLRPSHYETQQQYQTSSEESEEDEVAPLEKRFSNKSSARDLLQQSGIKKMKRPHECLDIALKYFKIE